MATVLDEQVEVAVRRGRAHRAAPTPPRERRTEFAAAAVFLAGAVPLELAAPSPVDFDPVLALVLVLTYAVAIRVRFAFALGQTDPSLLVLVPMLFLLPAHVVPLLVVCGFLVGRVPDYLSGRVHPDRAVNAFGDGIHVLGPALVLGLATAGGPHAADWPWFVLAFLAFVAGDFSAGYGRTWAAQGTRPPMTRRDVLDVYALDALLAPVGLLAAFASASFHYGFLLGAPLVVLLTGYAREREGRLSNALDLSVERTRALEAELAVTQVRYEVIGAVSHALQSPLAGVIGLTQVLEQRGDRMPDAQRAELVGALGVNAHKLRHLVRQTLDLTAMHAGRELHASPAPFPLEPLLGQLVARIPEGRASVQLALAPDATSVLADPARIEQILTTLIDNACRWGPSGGPVRVTSARAGEEVELRVADAGAGIAPEAASALFDPPGVGREADESQGVGFGLHIAAAAAGSMGGRLTYDADGAGTTFLLRLPRDERAGGALSGPAG